MDDRARKTQKQILEGLNIRADEQEWFESDRARLSFKSNAYYTDLALKSEGVRKQMVPLKQELDFLDYESGDPLSEGLHSPLPRMVHRYPNRVAVLVTDQCAVHCRHCFRRSFTGKGHKALQADEYLPMVEYINNHPGIKEVLLTGGDPMTLSDASLLDLVNAFRSCGDDLIIRLATRMPVVNPERISPELARSLGKLGPVWCVVQFNHPAELTDSARKAVRLLGQEGISLVNQSVLLKGINDDSDILADLFQGLLSWGVKPYYLFQGDLARGTSHFRTSLEQGWRIMDELRAKVSGLAMPVYAVDLPDGGGKIPLHRSLLIRKDESSYIFKNHDEREYAYPREDE